MDELGLLLLDILFIMIFFELMGTANTSLLPEFVQMGVTLLSV